MATPPPVSADKVDGYLQYRDGGLVLQEAMQYLILQCLPGEKLVSLCDKGDNFIIAKLDTIHRYLFGEQKGLGFPTCVSTKHTVANFSPPSTDETTLSSGDIVKIEISCHINGYVVGMAHSHVIGMTEKIPAVVHAAECVAQCALASMAAEMKINDFIAIIQLVAADHECRLGLLYPVFQLKQWTAKRLTSKDATFVKDTAYYIDLIVIPNDNKVFEASEDAFIFRTLDATLKRNNDGCIVHSTKSPPIQLACARELWKKAKSKKMPFTLRSIGGDEFNNRLGATSLVNLGLMEKYKLLCVNGEACARLTFTILVDKAGIEVVTPLFRNVEASIS